VFVRITIALLKKEGVTTASNLQCLLSLHCQEKVFVKQ